MTLWLPKYPRFFTVMTFDGWNMPQEDVLRVYHAPHVILLILQNLKANNTWNTCAICIDTGVGVGRVSNWNLLILCINVTQNYAVILVLCDEFIWEIWLISETWLDSSKLTYNTCNSTIKGSKNWSITFKGHKAVLLKAILAKTSNFWPIGPIQLKFWHLILMMECLKISLRGSHGSTFGPLWCP